PTVNAIFAAVPPAQMVTTIMIYSETFAALLRKHNQRVLNLTALTAGQAALRNEVIDEPDFTVLSLEFDDILDGIDLIQRYSLNSADASSLRAFLKHVRLLPSTEVNVLVAADQRLLRAARSEGL